VSLKSSGGADGSESEFEQPACPPAPRSTQWLIRVCHVGIAALGSVARVVGRDRLERPIAWMERRVKGALFDCRMCGQCLLDETNLGCPMRCPKELRNGPCGGVRADGHCEVDPAIVCAWRDIWMRKGGQLPDRQPPRDHRLSGHSTWLAEALDPPTTTPPLPPVRSDIPRGRFQRLLESGEFVVTSEVAPGTAADGSSLLAHAEVVAPWVDAINVTDASGANAALSSLAAAALLVRAGYTAVMQMTCRDRNRIALQNDLLSATALGIENVLCLTGDGVGNGDHPEAKPVFDLDAISLLATARTMRDGQQFLSGRTLSRAPQFFLGAVGNPFAPPEAARVQRLKTKIEAGAQFVQTQYVFDIPAFRAYMAQVRSLGLHRRCHIIAGVGLIGSARTARWLTSNVPGVRIPAHILERFEKSAAPLREGIALATELIRELRAMEGVAGVHLMFNNRIEHIPEVLDGAGLGQRRHQHEAAG
jgi:methylenetetrahydrofolate reductase (NADPH)